MMTSLAVSASLPLPTREAEIRRASGRPTDNMNSYDLYLRARVLSRTIAKANTLAGLDLVNRAIALDPDYGSALASAAIYNATIANFAWSDDPENHLSAAKSLLQRALKVAGGDAEVLSGAATATIMVGGDFKTATDLVDRAMVLNPGSFYVWRTSGYVRLAADEPQGAFEALETALRLDPFSQESHILVGMQGIARFTQGRFAEAVALLKQSAQLMPATPAVLAFLAASYGHLDDMAAAGEAIAGFQHLTTVEIREWTPATLTARKLYRAGIDLAEGKAPSGVASDTTDPR